MSRQPTILVFFEHAARELDVVCALKYLIEGTSEILVRVAHMSQVGALLSRVDPSVVVVPFWHNDDSWRGVRLVWRRSCFVNLAWEQLLSPMNEPYKMPKGVVATRHVIHHCWSGVFAGKLTRAGIPHESIFINGNPALALYDRPYRDYFTARTILASEFHLDSARPWVFFPENYAGAFLTDAEMTDMIRKTGRSRALALASREFGRRSFRETVGWCATAASAQGIQFIVRPRPATPPDRFLDALREVLGDDPVGVRVIAKYTARDWNLACDATLSTNSSCLVDAAVAGKPAYVLEPLPMPNFMQPAWYDLIPHIQREDDLNRTLKQRLRAESTAALASWARAELLSRGDPIRGLASFLAGIANGGLQRPPPAPKAVVSGRDFRRLPMWFNYEYRRARLLKESRRTNPYSPGVPMGAFELPLGSLAGEVEGRVSKWKEVIGTPMQACSP